MAVTLMTDGSSRSVEQKLEALGVSVAPPPRPTPLVAGGGSVPVRPTRRVVKAESSEGSSSESDEDELKV